MALAFNGKGGGGASSPVYSWLGAYLHTAIVAVGPTSANAVWDHPADALVGSDLSISVDGQTVTYLTTGLYVVSVYYAATSSSPPVLLTASPVFTAPQADSYWNLANTFPDMRVDASSSFQVTYPPAKIVAGDSMYVGVNTSGTMTLGTNTTLWVARIA